VRLESTSRAAAQAQAVEVFFEVKLDEYYYRSIAEAGFALTASQC
jgi:hypothetical protein